MISLRRIFDGLNAFLFKPISPLQIGFYRIVLGVLVLVNAFIYWPLRFVWFTEKGTLTLNGAHMVAAPPRLNLFDWAANWGWADDTLITWVLVIHILAALLMTAGLFTRVSTAIVFFTLTSMHHRNALVLNSGDTVMRLMVLYTAFSHAGRALSVDRLLAVARGKAGKELGVYSPWAQRVMQIQLSIVYFTTFLFKVDGSMWLDGTSIYYVSRLTDFQRFPVPILYNHLFTIRLLTYGSLLVEFALGVLVWFEELTYPALIAGVGLHFGIDWSMNIPLFEWLTATPYLLFIDPDDFKKWFGQGRDIARKYLARVLPQTATAVLFFDGSCRFCTATANVLSVVDAFRRIEMVDFREPGTLARYEGIDMARAEREMLIRVTRKGTSDVTWIGGFDAFHWLTARLPMLFLLALVLRVPGMKALGRRVYPFIARNRHKLLGVRCESGTCHVHAG